MQSRSTAEVLNSCQKRPIYDLKTEIRHLPSEIKRQVAQILDNSNHLERFMLDIPKDVTIDFKETDDYERKYQQEHLKAIINASDHQRRRRLNGEILIDEWGTSGHVRPKLVHLIMLLDKKKILRASNLLRESIGLESITPKTEVMTSELLVFNDNKEAADELDMQYDLPLLTGLNLGDAMEFIDNNVTPITLEMEEIQHLREFKYRELEEKTNYFNEMEYKGLAAPGRKIGSGGFGTVFLAKDLFDHIPFVAVKRCKASRAETSKYFFRELKVIATVDHVNIIKLLGYCTDVKACLVFEYASRGSLKEKLKGARQISIFYHYKDRVRNLLEVASALMYLHNEKGLIHRDIKPENILLERVPVAGEREIEIAKLCDFGLIRDKDDELTTRVVGTNYYMAPESHFKDNTISADIYALGIVMLETLTGLIVFDESKPQGEKYLRDYVRNRIQDQTKITDFLPICPSMPTDNTDRLELVKLSLSCATEEKSARPLIKEIYEKLLEKCEK